MNEKIITAKLNDGRNLELSLSEAEKVAAAVRWHHCREDVLDYLENGGNYIDTVLDNHELVDCVTETYVKYRSDADGGEEEACMHWRVCLENAIEYNRAILSPYRTRD